MPVEVGLSDGTRLVIADNNTTEDDVLRQFNQGHGLAGAVRLQTTEGAFRVFPAHVVYVRDSRPTSRDW